MTKHSVCCSRYLRNHRSYDRHLWYTSVKWWYFQVLFFSFFKILIFWVVRSVKGHKMTQNGKIMSVTLHFSGTIHHMIFIYGTHCPSSFIFPEPNIIWSLFGVRKCKVMIFPRFFYFFKILIFRVLRRRKV